MPKKTRYQAGDTKASKSIILRISPELWERLKQGATLRGMDLSPYLRKAGTDALNKDHEFVKNHGKTAYLGATPMQVDKFLNAPLSPEEIYYSNQRRMEADTSVKILSSRLAALEERLAALEKTRAKRKPITERSARQPLKVELLKDL